MNGITKFVLIDDDSTNNLICKFTIKKIDQEVDIESFTSARDGISYFLNLGELCGTILLFLDLNMPEMSGWEFLEELEKFPEALKQNIFVIILTSSIDERDRDKAKQIESVKGFISKPLRTDDVLKAKEALIYH